MNICIVTKDALLSRFIALELRESGYTALESECIKEGAEFYICDLDSVSESIPSGAIGFSYDESKSRLVQTFLQRPIDAEKLREAVSKKFSAAHPKSDNEMLVVDRLSRTVSSFGGEIRLSKKEFALLCGLCEKKIMTREEGAKIFGSGDSNVVDVYIHYLRGKLSKVCDIETVKSKRGEGYFLSEQISVKFT